ncbi:MAG: PqqD family protein [Sphingomicrobium sp.]
MSSIVKRSDRFTEADIDDEIVVMRLDNGEFFSLSGTSAQIWRLIDGCRDRTALVAALAAEFDADEGRIAADVDAFLVELEESGLLARD